MAKEKKRKKKGKEKKGKRKEGFKKPLFGSFVLVTSLELTTLAVLDLMDVLIHFLYVQEKRGGSKKIGKEAL